METKGILPEPRETFTRKGLLGEKQTTANETQKTTLWFVDPLEHENKAKNSSSLASSKLSAVEKRPHEAYKEQFFAKGANGKKLSVARKGSKRPKAYASGGPSHEWPADYGKSTNCMSL